jgi:hypothetical protein
VRSNAQLEVVAIAIAVTDDRRDNDDNLHANGTRRD